MSIRDSGKRFVKIGGIQIMHIENIGKVEELEKKVQKIKQLQEAKFGSDEAIEVFLELPYPVKTILEMWEVEKDLYTINQAVEKLNIDLKDVEKWSYDKVFRYLNPKKVKDVIPSVKIKNERRIKKEDLENFIEERTMTKEDYKQKYKDLMAKNSKSLSLVHEMRDDLDKKVKALEKENAEKDARIKELEEQLKALQVKKTGRPKKEDKEKAE